MKIPHDSHFLNIAIILEAAGSSSRFGSNKLLHIMDDGRPMIFNALDAARGASEQPGCRARCSLILVTQYAEIASLAHDFEVVMNDRPDLGISRSMQLGIAAAGDADAYLFCVCDQPGLTSSTLSRLIDEYINSSAGIISLSWHGQMRNPKIFSSKYRGELMALRGDKGGRQIIIAHTDDLMLVEADSEAETIDIDRPDSIPDKH